MRHRLAFAAAALPVAAAVWWVVHVVGRGAPRSLVLATGPEGSADHEIGKRYQAIFARSGVRLHLLATAGSVENLARLSDARSGADAGFVLAGTTSAAAAPGVESLGVVGYELLWIFMRSDLPGPPPMNLDRMRVSIGREGSGAREVALKLIAAGHLKTSSTKLLALGPDEAGPALERHEIDAAVILMSWDSPVVQRLLVNPAVRLFSIARAQAMVALDPSLNRFVLPAGVADMEKNIPPADVTLLGSAVSLAVRKDLHLALKYLLLEAAAEIHSRPAVFQRAGQFPAAEAFDIPLGEEARHYYKAGRPFLQRYLPFWLASAVEQSLLVLIPLFGVVYPILKSIPAAIRWFVQRRIQRLYGELKLLELDVQGAGHGEAGPDLVSRLEHLETRAARLRVPLSYAASLYSLRSHIGLVRGQVGSGSKE